MPQGLNNTKRRIQSISSTKKITKAMELVATVKLKKWKTTVENISSYLEVMQEIVSSCSSGSELSDILELTKFNNAESDLYVVVTSSLGLCGGYNYNLFKFLNGKITSKDKVFVVGTKGFAKFNHDEQEMNSDFVDLLDHIDYLKVIGLIKQLKHEYSSGKYKHVYLVSTEYKNSLTFVPKEFQLLPLEAVDLNNDGDIKTFNHETIFEPSREEVLTLVIPKYLSTLIYGKLMEASVCEQAARRNAMDSATDNAEELLEKLKLEYNKARQSAITQEITEVVAGARNA